MKPSPKNTAPALRHLPYARYHTDWRLVTWHPLGILDDEMADRVVEFVETEERIGKNPFHRYTDLAGLTRLQLGLDHVFEIAKRRQRGYGGPPVKSAFYAVRLISLCIARLYQELMHSTRIQVGVFRDRAAVAGWLSVPVEVLHPPISAGE